jgi:hypothetical protein
VTDGWCWFVLREKYCWLVVVREKYCWLVADKPNENEKKYFADQFEKTAYTLPYTQMKLSWEQTKYYNLHFIIAMKLSWEQTKYYNLHFIIAVDLSMNRSLSNYADQVLINILYLNRNTITDNLSNTITNNLC